MRTSAVSRRWIGYLSALGALVFCPLAAHAVPLITLGTYNLQPNDSLPQTINIYVSGGDVVGGLDLDLTIGNGSGVGTTPMISAATITASGQLFVNGAGNLSVPISSRNGQFYEIGTELPAGQNVPLSGTSTDPITGIPNQGLLATVSIVTLGVNSGSFSISVGGTDGYHGGSNVGFPILTQATAFPPESSTEVGSANTNFIDGTIVVPEPASLGLLGLAVSALLIRRRQHSMPCQA